MKKWFTTWEQLRPRSAWADAQADLGLCYSVIEFLGFVKDVGKYRRSDQPAVPRLISVIVILLMT